MATKKVMVPDGKGGWKEVEGEVMAGKELDKERQQKVLEKQFEDDGGALTERIWKYLNVTVGELGLEKEHLVFAVGLLCVNLRETFPDGKKTFDALTEQAAKYYDRNKPRR